MKIILQNTKNFEKHFNFKFLKPQAKIHSNGFISVVLDWTNLDNKKFHDFKYVDLAHYSSGGIVVEKRKKYYNIRTASFEFVELKELDWQGLKMSPWFEISLVVENEQESFDKQFDYLFFHNTKYGVICWFAPKDWEDWDNTKDL